MPSAPARRRSAAALAAAPPSLPHSPPHHRHHNTRERSSVPEYWGRDSPYHGGTEFLGTPKNHLALAARRPLSPHVFEIDGKAFHYKMPWGATSSILNRATGTALSAGAAAAAWLALAGDVGAAVDALRAAHPLLLYPAKFAVAFPLAYHYAAGVRHLYWDHYSYGNQADKSTPLEVKAVERSSRAVLGAGAAVAAALAAVSF